MQLFYNFQIFFLIFPHLFLLFFYNFLLIFLLFTVFYNWLIVLYGWLLLWITLILKIINWCVYLRTRNRIHNEFIWSVIIIIDFRRILAVLHNLWILLFLLVQHFTFCLKYIIFRLMQFLSYLLLQNSVPFNTFFAHYWLLQFIGHD